MKRTPAPRKHRIAATVLALLLSPTAAFADALDTGSAEVSAFIDRMVETHGMDRDELIALLSEAEIQDNVLERIAAPAEAWPWHRYRPIFVQRKRAAKGARFWEEHADTVRRAAETYGIDEAYLVSIIGVESNYGKIQGRIRVLDSLATLGFAYPPRQSFFRSELEHFLLLADEAGFDPREVKGSYAGAMGSPQFISSSYRNYAVDFDGDGRIDLWDSWPDIIGSVAAYFGAHRWRTGEPVATPAAIGDRDVEELVTQGLELDRSLGQLADADILSSFTNALPADTPAMLIRLEHQSRDEYWVALHNYRVITRYNRSQLYAMAVHQLSGLIVAERLAD